MRAAAYGGFFILAGAASATSYHVTDLADVSQYDAAFINRINAAGVGVGEVFVTSQNTLAVQFENGNITALPELPGRYGEALGINDSGIIVGTSIHTDEGADFHPVSWTVGNIKDLGSVFKHDSGYSGAAHAINAAGDICGSIWDWNLNTTHAFIVIKGKMKDLGTPAWASSLNCSGINSKRHFAGTGFDSVENNLRAFLYRDKEYVLIGDFGDGSLGSIAHDINSKDLVVGSANHADDSATAFLWSKGVLKDLGSLPGDTGRLYSEAMAINDSGLVVGVAFADAAGDKYAAFEYSGKKMVDLNDLLDESGTGWHLDGADSVNASGEIAGHGTLNGVKHLFLLSPNP